ncbi:T-lymphocyte activation antigen CD86 [Bombina bombina]|uniref:T-lymphocyte activation antigen CD86 n=1 Tax=Bombina bombina TaxID=8345 RepID=UPI00235B0385|nr:T-lymphocyte activation antigen CD86 [Bombina bombina]
MDATAEEANLPWEFSVQWIVANLNLSDEEGSAVGYPEWYPDLLQNREKVGAVAQKTQLQSEVVQTPDCEHCGHQIQYVVGGPRDLFYVLRTGIGCFAMLFITLTACLMTLIQSIGTTDVTNGLAYVNEKAVLNCNVNLLDIPNNGTLDFYWQKEIKPIPAVLFELNGNVKNMENIDEIYKNRTMSLQSNWNLYLYNITVEDEGEYSCHINKKINTWREKHHMGTYNLKVIANFTTPEIFPPQKQKMKKGEVLNLTCLIKHGYPNPKELGWILFNSSGPYEISSNSRTDKDEKTKLLSITSQLTLQVHENMNITCRILDENNQAAEIVTIELEIPTTIKPPSNNVIICIAIVSVVTLTVFIFLFICMKRRKKVCCQRRKIAVPSAPGQNEDRQINSNEVKELLHVDQHNDL